MWRLRTFHYPALFALLWLVSACATTKPRSRLERLEARLPEVPHVRGPLDIHVTYPTPDAVRPDVDSTFVFGVVGRGDARLQIDGLPVEVAANGAFLAYVPVPADGVYHLVASADGQRDTTSFSYAAPPPSPFPPTRQAVAFREPHLGVVVAGKDTLATGSQSAHAAPTPGGDRRWLFPIGTRLTVTGRMGDQVHVKLTSQTDAWMDGAFVQVLDPGSYQVAPVGRIVMHPDALFTDVIIPTDFAPFRIDPQAQVLGVTIYGRTAADGNPTPSGLIQDARWVSSSGDSTRLDLRLKKGLWGYKAFFDRNGTLVLRIRRPPEIDPSEPLRGLRIMVDAGHPPGGAVGPTGLREPEANLAIAQRMAILLKLRGAVVLTTRIGPQPLVSATSAATELWARVDSAVAWNADLLVSVHNNAFPEGVNPFEHFGTETFYYYPFSAPLAQEVLNQIVQVTGIPDLGAIQRSLALVRPSWFPSTLTESLFMMFPRQEAALRSPEFLDRLAAAHVQGIENYLRRYLESSGE